MITLLVDEAYALDYLSILEVKLVQKNIGFEAVEQCKSLLACQISQMPEVYISHEYCTLYMANLKIFNLLEDENHPASYDEIAAANKARFKAKQALQQKFFGRKMQVETKTGRDA